MANHAYVIFKGEPPSPERIEKDVREIAQAKFPMLVLTGSAEGSWYLHYPPMEGTVGMRFWPDKRDWHEWDDAPEDVPPGESPHLEFSHRHQYEFMWWVEHEIREELAKRYDAYGADDGDNGIDPPSPARYANYSEYLADVHRARRKDPNWILFRDLKNADLARLRRQLPVDLLCLIGPPIA